MLAHLVSYFEFPPVYDGCQDTRYAHSSVPASRANLVPIFANLSRVFGEPVHASMLATLYAPYVELRLPGDAAAYRTLFAGTTQGRRGGLRRGGVGQGSG